MSVQHHIRPLGINDGGAGGEAPGEASAGGASGGLQGGQNSEEVGPEAVDVDDDSAQRPEEGQAAEDAAIEDPAVRAAPDPGQPTRDERARHELTHLPFRPWCADCVAGRAVDDPHRRLAQDADVGPPKVSVDYGFVADGEQARTILVAKVAGSKVIMARCVKGKGRADPHAVGWLVEQLRRLGIGRCVLQADGEPAQKAFVKDVIEEVCRTSTTGVASTHTPAHDHQANGGVEKAARDVKDQERVMRCALARHIGPVQLAQPVFEWMVAWAAELLTGAQVGHDGMTAYRRLRGRNWEAKLAEFAEQVLARRPRARLQGDAEPRWDQTTYLGTQWGSAEHFVADADGTVRKVRTIRRVPMAERWNRERIACITGVPDELGCVGDPAAEPEQVVVVVPHPEGAPEPPRLTRGFRIQMDDLRTHGYTQQCPKCDAVRIGRSVGTGHSAACRERFKAIFTEQDDGRVERAEGRRADAVDHGGPDAVVEMEVGDDEAMGEAAQEGMSEDDFIPLPPGEGDMDPEQFLPMMSARPARMKWADQFDDEDDIVDESGVWADFQSVELAENLVTVVTRGAAREVEPKEQVRRLCYVAGLSEQSSRRVVTELFSPPRVAAKIREVAGASRGLAVGTSFDLTVDQDTGESWDFLDVDHRRRCWERLKAEDPWVVIGSPPFTAFSVPNSGLNKNRVDPVRQKRQMAEAKVLMGFALGVYTWQVCRGRYFVHEHPATASSWNMPEVDALRRRDGVSTMICDACVFGLRAFDRDGQEKPAKKPTRWMSNAPRLLRSLGFRCMGRHSEHTRLLGGRAAAAAVYPPELVLAIARGLQAQREEDCRAGRMPLPLSAAIIQAISGDINELSALSAARTVRDEYTGEPLDPELVKRGMDEELRYFRSKNVWEVMPRSRAAGRRVVGTRWVCSNKGDAEHPEIRCRLVCQEVKTYQTEEFFAATPPIESLRMILSLAAEGPGRHVTLVDISRA